MKAKGFTLIELIVVVSVMGILGLMFTDTLINALRGDAKVRVINQVKQNGQVVLDRLSNEIRQSEKVLCINRNESQPSAPDDTITIFREGKYIRFRLISPTNTANGYIFREEFFADNILDVVSDTELCTRDAYFDLPNRITFLSDRDSKNGVSLDYASSESIFQRATQAGYSDIVTIKFTATAGVEAGSAYESTVKDGGILFQTSVQVRGGK